VGKFCEDQYLVMLTVNGYIKKVPLNVFSAIRSTGIISIRLVYYPTCPYLFWIIYFWAILNWWYMIYHLNMLGSWRWAQMGPSLWGWWPCCFGFTKWDGYSQHMQQGRLQIYISLWIVIFVISWCLRSPMTKWFSHVIESYMRKAIQGLFGSHHFISFGRNKMKWHDDIISF
jgi:hypothetical protein